MKKSTAVVISVIVAILVIAGCIWAYMHFTQKENVLPSPSGDVKHSGESIENKDSGEKVTNEPIFTKENYPRIDASTAIQPLTEAIKEDFVGEDAAEIETEYLDTHYGVLGVVDGTRDVCFMSYPSEEELAYAKEKNVELEIVKATNSAFVFIVNVDNPVNSLTLEQIRGIYSGKITNWKEVGGEDAEIIPYQRPVNSGSQSGMLQLVMKDTPMMQAPKTQLTVGMGDLVDAIAQYDNSRYALGYSYYYYVNTMYKRDTIKMLAIDGVAPNKDTIRAGEYPIMTSGWLVFRKDEPEDSMTRKWVKTLTSKRGASVIEAAGYVPAN